MKTCKCGRSYTEAEWRKLDFRGFMDDLDVNPDGRRLELRDCLCGSTIAIERPPAPRRSGFVFVGRLQDLVRRLALLGTLALTLAACGPGPDFSTKLGVDVYGAAGTSFSLAQADTTEAWTADLFESMGYARADVEACIGQAQLHIDPSLMCDGCGGFQISGKPDLYILSYPCGWTTAAGFAHELSHWMQDCLHDPWAPDADHQEDAIWWHGFSTFRYECTTP